jgi:microcystin-dependent protein
MAYSYVTVTATNGQTNFAFGFPYLAKSHILAFVDANPVTFTWLNSQTIVLDTPVVGTPEVTIRRATPRDAVLIDFHDGSIQKESEMDAAQLQQLYIAQEITDGSDDLAASDAANAAIQARDAALVAVTEAETAAADAAAAITTIENMIDDFEELAFASETIGSNIASAATINPTGAFQLVTGSVDISDFSTSPSSCRLRFQNELNITHNSKFICPHGVNYRVIPGEILEFRKRSTGPDVYSVYSLNGPPEGPGDTRESYRASIPGFLEEDGLAIDRTTYSGLYAVIGVTHGPGNGSTTFNKPDSRGRTTINMDNGAGVITSASVGGANANTMGGKGGAQMHTLTQAETPLKLHAHVELFSDGSPVNTGFGGGSPSVPVMGQGLVDTDTGDMTTSNTSDPSATAHNNCQPWIAKKKFIRF